MNSDPNFEIETDLVHEIDIIMNVERTKHELASSKESDVELQLVSDLVTKITHNFMSTTIYT